MKILCDINSKDIDKYINSGADGFILYLKDYSVNGNCYFDVDEICEILTKYDKDFFVSINKNMFNSDLDDLLNIMLKLSKLPIKGIMFYDMSILYIKIKNNLDIDLVWCQEHMTTNYNTCNYYYKRGVKYSYLSSEITLDEILDIKKKSDIIPLVFVFGRCFVAYSRRKLVSNYYTNCGDDKKNNLRVLEKVSGDYYNVFEDCNGSSFNTDKIMNGLRVIDKLYNNNFPYIVFREDGIDSDTFLELISDVKKFIDGGCSVTSLFDKYNKLFGDYTGFLFKKTIYRVK